MMIDHRQVCFRCLTPCAKYETITVVTAFLTQTVIRGRGHKLSDTRIFRQIRQFGEITTNGLLRPGADAKQMGDIHRIHPGSIDLDQIQPVQAQIIRPAL